MLERRKPRSAAGTTCDILLIDRSPQGLATAEAFRQRFPGFRQSIAKWHETGFEFLIFGSIPASNETTFIWAKDLEDLLGTALPTLKLAMADRRLIPHIVIVVAPEIKPTIADLLRPQLH